nr:hypothetical protein 3 - fruit fly (Drosophila melanogaster) retrotransposon mgd1 [Drosophila melanogaster]
MDWQEIQNELKEIKTTFDKSYKCMTPNREVQQDTLNKHAQILVRCFNGARQLIYRERKRLTKNHLSQAVKFLNRFRENLLNVKYRHNLNITIPTILSTPIVAEIGEDIESVGESEIEIKEEDLHDLAIPAVITLPELLEEELSDSNTGIRIQETDKMTDSAATAREYVRQISSTIPEFDGKKLNLNRFLTALRLIDLTKGDQEMLAVEVIKTKILGPLSHKVENEKTIIGIINLLKASVKGESPDVIKAKMLSTQQRGKTAAQYTTEIENLRGLLEAAYIDDGLDSNNADKFATKEAISAMTKNCGHDKLKTILEAGNFNTMNSVIEKYIHCSTEMTGNSNSVLFYNNRGHYRGNNYRGNYQNRGNGRGNYNSYNNNYRGRGGYHGGNRGRGGNQNYNRGGGYSRGNQNHNYKTSHAHNVRNIQSENEHTPLSDNLQ